MMRATLFVLTALLLGWVVDCGAHEMRPAFLALQQSGTETFSVIWKVPARGDLRLALYPRFPDNCRPSSEPIHYPSADDKYEKKTGGKLLAIPHNGNLSNGRMFELIDFAGRPLSRDYAERRARWEVLQEVMQTKGNSETHPTLSPNDEFADFGILGWDNGNLILEGKPETPAMRPYMYLRGGLLQGLALEQKLGANPFKFGFIGGTDVHNSVMCSCTISVR